MESEGAGLFIRSYKKTRSVLKIQCQFSSNKSFLFDGVLNIYGIDEKGLNIQHQAFLQVERTVGSIQKWSFYFLIGILAIILVMITISFCCFLIEPQRKNKFYQNYENKIYA